MNVDLNDLKNIKLTIEYDGTNYSGWQTQINSLAIADVLRESIEKLLRVSDLKLIGASRTDAGVHAYGQVANFYTASKIPPEKFSFAINNYLPNDIVVVDSKEVSSDFHSRFSTKGKTYIYKIYNRRYPSAILRNRVYPVHSNLNIRDMKTAANQFIGTQDFEAFRAVGCSAKSSVRTIEALDVWCDEQELINIEITGDGFLYNMVRIIVGTLVSVGLGKIQASQIGDILLSRDRRQAGRTAPACGLYLKQVFYE